MSDLTDTARMDEAKRMMASQANTSVFLMDAELTARNRYETETDIEEQTAAFVDGVAWCAQHLHEEPYQTGVEGRNARTRPGRQRRTPAVHRTTGMTARRTI